MEELDQADELQSMFTALENAACRLGFDGVLYSYVPSVVSESLEKYSPVFIKTDSYDNAYIQHYMEAGFAEHDFTVKRISAGVLQPINWWQEVENKTLSCKEKHIIDVARHDYHLCHGATIPTLYNIDGAAGISVISLDRSQSFTTLYQNNLKSLRTIGRHFSDRVLLSAKYRGGFYLPFLQKLSATQQQVLKGLALGQHLKKIAADLNISYRYACNVVDQLREKFGHVSRERMMYMAGLMGFDALV